jgi:hypothetical protein
VRVEAQALASGAEALRFADAVNAMSFDLDENVMRGAEKEDKIRA